jgi:hypothetical protein
LREFAMCLAKRLGAGVNSTAFPLFLFLFHLDASLLLSFFHPLLDRPLLPVGGGFEEVLGGAGVTGGADGAGGTEGTGGMGEAGATGGCSLGVWCLGLKPSSGDAEREVEGEGLSVP